MIRVFILLSILFFLNLNMFANVKLSAPNSFTNDEAIVFSITASGKKIEFPKITQIQGHLVQNIGSSQSTNIINGNYTSSIKNTFKIIANSNVLIPKLKFIIDGEIFYTQKKLIKLKKINKTISKDFDLSLISKNKNLYVGQSTNIKLIFKYNKNLQITDLSFIKPDFKDFWNRKTNKQSKRYEDNDYIIQELEFLLFPQKAGVLSIKPLKIAVQMIDNTVNSYSSLFQSTKNKYIYSNSLKFYVKPLPKNIHLIGKFNINASINKNKINQGEAVSYKLIIKGQGNFEDIKDIKLDIKDASIYDNKAKITTSYKNNIHQGEYVKNFSIIPNSSLIIPKITLKYFDKTNNKIISISTKEFKINVKNKKIKKVELEKKQEKNIVRVKEIIKKQEVSFIDKFLYFICGTIFTLLMIVLYFYIKHIQKIKKQETLTLVVLLKKSKTKNELINILIPYIKKDSKLDDLIFKLENLKTNEDIKSIKKELILLAKELGL